MKIWAWGANSNGQLGLGFKSEQESRPTLVKLPDLPKSLQDKDLLLRDICGGAYHTLVLALAVQSSSKNHEKQQILVESSSKYCVESINVSNTFEILCFPQAELQFVDVELQIASGFDSNFYLYRNGQAKSFGDNSYCQLGRKISTEEASGHKKNSTKLWNGLDYDAFNAQHLADLDLPIFTTISIGLRHGAAINYEKDLYVWGDNSKYQGGIYREIVDGGGHGREEFPKLVQHPTKVHFPPNFKFGKIACGKDFTIAVHDSGYLFGCGQNKHGVLLHAPQDVKEFRKFTHIFNHLSSDADIADIQAGWSHVLVLLTNGRVLSWGRNNFGQLGRTSVNPDFDVEPGYVTGFPEKIMSIKCGSEHNLALTESGKVYAWGWNEHDNCGVDKSPQFPEDPEEPMVLEEEEEQGQHFDETDISSRSPWRKDCILFPTLVKFPQEDVSPIISVIGCGAGSSFAISCSKG